MTRQQQEDLMKANHDSSSQGLRGWWASPPRTGMRRIIAPWEYRHLRGFAQVRIASGVVLAVLGLITLSAGGNNAKTYAWTIFFLAVAAAQLAFAYWLLSIARSTAS
jgi:hypothetical protein